MNPRLLTWPVLPARGIRPAAGSPVPRESVPSACPRVLFVDDDPEVRSLGKLALTRAGYAAEVAGNGAEAWDALVSESYQLLVTDHQMPRLTGLELAAQARRAGMRLPIIMISGSLDPTSDPACVWLDFSAFLPKPFALRELLNTVARVLPAIPNRAPVAASPPPGPARDGRGVQPYLHFGINE